MYTMLTCPKCHRMYDSPVTQCDAKTGGCGYVIPQAKPALAATPPAPPAPHLTVEEASKAAPHLTVEEASKAAPHLTVEEASKAATAAVNALHAKNHG